jgi:hypothetical protein
MIDIIDVPEKFMPICSLEYPFGNTYPFEDWFVNVFLREHIELKSDRKYLPIRWTAYTTNNDWGQDKVKRQELQEYINSLPRNIKYFTIVQQAPGIHEDLKNLDIIVFCMGGFNLSTLRYEPCKENIKNVSIPLFYNLPSSKRIDSTNE